MYLKVIVLHSDHRKEEIPCGHRCSQKITSDGPDLDLYTGSILSRWPAQVQPDTKCHSHRKTSPLAEIPRVVNKTLGAGKGVSQRHIPTGGDGYNVDVSM